MPAKTDKRMKASRIKRSRPVAQAANELTELALRACLIASDAAFNTRDFLANAAQMAFLAVRDCEKELDRIEQQIDEQLPARIAEVAEPEARELLACLRFSTELERIGDLLWGVAQSARSLESKLPASDSEQLLKMLDLLEKLLQSVREGFVERDLDPAAYVLRADREMDLIYKTLFRKYLQTETPRGTKHRADVLLMAQALERSGDHATNLAEELFRLIEGRSLRHIPKRQLKD
jgi:phosphate transport system protein